MEDRKKDHINLAFQSRVESAQANTNFYYEPLLAAHPTQKPQPFDFAGKQMRLPLWISSMTGGTQMAGKINRNLAVAAREFGLGMGLGSCRTLLDNHNHLADFDVRSVLGDDQPLYANLGICQLEKLIESKQTHRIEELINTLRADGIIIHINPLQEAFQPEGDVLHHTPIELIEAFLQETKLRVIVKEVGQGIGPQSLARLLELPLEAIEFGALGGTNFSLLELNRHQTAHIDNLQPFVNVGHTASEMLSFVNQYVTKHPDTNRPQLIISGGITSILDGYALVKTSKLPSVVGMGAALLKHAIESEASLIQFVAQMEKSWMLADAFLKIKSEKK